MFEDPKAPMSAREKVVAVAAAIAFLALIYAAGQWEPNADRQDPPRQEYEREWGR